MAKIQITDAELEIMRILWKRSPLTAPEVVKRVKEVTSWERTTITTMLSRLVKKEALAQDGEPRSYCYRPLIAERDYAAIECGTLLEKFFGGEPGNLLEYFIKHEKLSEEDIAHLKSLLNEERK